MISHCWYFIRLSTGGRLSAPVGPVRSRDGPPVNFVTKIFPRPFKIPVPVPVNRKRRTAVFCPSRDYCRRVLQRRGPFCLRKLSLLRSCLTSGWSMAARAPSSLPPSPPESWVVPASRAHLEMRVFMAKHHGSRGKYDSGSGWAPSVVVESRIPVRLLTERAYIPYIPGM